MFLGDGYEGRGVNVQSSFQLVYLGSNLCSRQLEQRCSVWGPVIMGPTQQGCLSGGRGRLLAGNWVTLTATNEEKTAVCTGYVFLEKFCQNLIPDSVKIWLREYHMEGDEGKRCKGMGNQPNSIDI